VLNSVMPSELDLSVEEDLSPIPVFSAKTPHPLQLFFTSTKQPALMRSLAVYTGNRFVDLLVRKSCESL